jgi:hypothetical protein
VLLEQAHQFMHRIFLSSVKASMLTDGSGFSTVMAQTWFTAQARTVQRGQRQQLSVLLLTGISSAFGLTEHTCITPMLLFRQFIIGVEHRTAMEQSLGVRLSRLFQQHITKRII